MYNGLAHMATGTATGVFSESLGGLDLSATTHTNSGTYNDSWTFSNTNYKDATGTVTDVIAPATAGDGVLTITVNGYSGIYDGLAHGATGSATGVGGENLNALLNLGASFVNVTGGTANWTFAGNANYAPTSGTAAIVIGKAPLTVTANNASRLYGYANPTFTASYSGFKNGETLATSGVTGNPSLTTTATTSSAVGSYVITAAAGSLAANNYSFNFTDGTLTVFLGGFIGLDSVSMRGSNSVVDSFNSSDSTHGSSAAVLSNGAIDIGGRISGTVVSAQGSVSLQPNGAVSGDVSAGTTISNRGTVSGSINPNSPSGVLVGTAVPSCGAFTLNPSISGDFTYSNGDLKVTGQRVAILAAGSYCFHSITLTGGATIQVNGAVSISLTGELNAGGGSFSNTTRIPANLAIASSYSGKNGVSINGGADVFLTLYAPTTEVSVTGNASVFGSMLGKTLTVVGNPDLHYDTQLNGF
jgi:hypothetical protein